MMMVRGDKVVGTAHGDCVLLPSTPFEDVAKVLVRLLEPLVVVVFHKQAHVDVDTTNTHQFITTVHHQQTLILMASPAK